MSDVPAETTPEAQHPSLNRKMFYGKKSTVKRLKKIQRKTRATATGRTLALLLIEILRV